MEQKKYWKQVTRGPFYINAEPGTTGPSIWAHHDEFKNGTTLGYHCINDNYEASMTHSHDFHELLCFIGGNPENIDDLGAEVHICLGDELEEHVITSATVVSIPPGMKHCPLKVTKITRPFIFLEISTTKDYGQPKELQETPAGAAAAEQVSQAKKSKA
jgi:hypothetical protein